MKNICAILAGNPDFQKLITKAHQLTQLNRLFKSLLDPNLAKHCNLAKLEKDQMTVIADNSAWATKLRFSIPDILKNLRIQPEFKMVKTIKFSVATAETKTPNLAKQKHSTKSAELWKETIKTLKNKKTFS